MAMMIRSKSVLNLLLMIGVMPSDVTSSDRRKQPLYKPFSSQKLETANF